MWKDIEIRSRRHVEIIDVTDRVAAACRNLDARDGLVIVICKHTTAGVCVNEGDPKLHQDLERWLESIAPTDREYAHNAVDDNAEAHLRSILLGHNATIPLAEGSLSLGQWQRILFVELDGPRTRELQVGLMPVAG